jgi:hypothetical protein
MIELFSFEKWLLNNMFWSFSPFFLSKQKIIIQVLGIMGSLN